MRCESGGLRANRIPAFNVGWQVPLSGVIHGSNLCSRYLDGNSRCPLCDRRSGAGWDRSHRPQEGKCWEETSSRRGRIIADIRFRLPVRLHSGFFDLVIDAGARLGLGRYVGHTDCRRLPLNDD